MTEGGLDKTEGLNEIEKEFVSDFYWSYRHSQGSFGIQAKLFDYLTWKYAQQNFQPNNNLLGVVNGMMVPTQHTEFVSPQTKIKVERKMTDNPHRGGSGKDSWDIFLQTLQKNKEMIKNNPGVDIGDHQREEIVPEIFYDLVLRDYRYQGFEDASRINRKNNADPNESFLRSYILDEKKAETPQFRDLYRKMGVVMEKVRNNEELKVEFPPLLTMKHWLDELIQKWEENHPGQHFFE